MHPLPKISVITPSLNQAKYIERTICSVLDQHYPNLEYIIVDGGSVDGTLDILQRYQDRLTWISEKDQGQSDAINKGMSMATGDILAYLNADDVYEPDALETVARHFQDNPASLWLTGRCRIVDEDDHAVRSIITTYKNLLLDRYSYRLLLITNPVSQPATFWRRHAAEVCGPFDIHEHLAMDYEYWLKLGRTFAPLIIDEELACFRIHKESKTSSSFTKTFKQELLIARRFSGSNITNILHFISYCGISFIYSLLRFLKI